MVVALATLTVAEPPSGYNYPRGGGGFSGGGGFGGGGFSGGGGLGGGGGGGYQAVSGGFQTSEGQNVDPQLLEQVRQILLNEESKSGGGGGGGGGGFSGAPSGSYGAPSPQYGAPSFSGGRVVGIDLEGVRQAIQVAQFAQQSSVAGGGFAGYPSSQQSRPSGSYGAPF